MTDALSQPPVPDPDVPKTAAPGDAQLRREQRRAAARTTQRRRRLQAVVGLLALIIVIVVATGSDSPFPSAKTARERVARAHPAPVVSGGPLAPAYVGGLPSLWAPPNVVAPQPTTAAAYAAASHVPGPAGFILIADRGNNRILVVDPQRRTVFRFPTPADLAAGRKLYYNDDTFVTPGGASLIANEEDNHAIVQVGIADHSVRVLFGHPGVLGGGPTHLNTPDDAYALPDGTFTVADAYNCRILFIKSRQIVNEYGRAGNCHHAPPQYLGAVNGDTPQPDGGVMISEIAGWVDSISATGQLEFSVKAPVSYPSDPQPLPGGRILLADYNSRGQILIIDHAGRVLWRYAPSQGPGRLDHPSLAMPLPNGNIAVNDDYRHRVVVIDPRTHRIVWQYGHTDLPGTAYNYLHTPDGMDFIPAAPNGTPDYAAVVHP